MSEPDWWQDWRGECVAIVAAGPSAKTAGVEKLRDRIHVIAINESHRLTPFADIVYSCDPSWWDLRFAELKHFDGIKLAFDHPREKMRNPGAGLIAKLKIPERNNCWVNEFLFDKPGVVGSGGHSGFQMLNLAAQFGATGIALIGFDMNAGGAIHWHGLHPSPLRNPDAGRFFEWRKLLDEQAPRLSARGIDVVNCSFVSTLTAFPKLSIDQMLERWGL